MLALSISPDYALEMLEGLKTTEYRSWQTKHRGDLLICSTAKKNKRHDTGPRPDCLPDEKIKFITYTSDKEVEGFVDKYIIPLFYK